MTPGRIVLASGNPDKLREIRLILPGIVFASILDWHADWDVEETGLTIRENALIKARAAAAETGMPAVAEDTGLFAWALGGAPGVYSARYAGPGCTYADNVRKILNALLGENGDLRKAEFRTAAALVTPDGAELAVEGVVKGMITLAPEGSGGFGYDPVFFCPELNMTFAEASDEEKNRVSHRARAFAALRPHLEALRG
ncbi:MAG: RdgB/HAM1 family non-canonical purine NTP pyrophosphatase [Candidatus Fermentibacteraceae bacterium]